MTPQQHATRAVATAVLAVATLVAVSGCSVSAEPSPSPTPTAAFSSEEEAFAAAEEVYRAYIDAFNGIDFRDPSTFEAALELTAGDYAATERKSLSEMHAEGYVRGGDVAIITFVPISAEGTQIQAQTCNDVSQTTFTDADGDSLVPPDRPNRVALDLEFEVADGTVLLVDAVPREDESCAES